MRSTITTSEVDGSTLVEYAGDVDLALRGQADRSLRLAMAAGSPVVVDLARVRYIDSSGVTFLLQHHRACVQAGFPLTVRHVPQQARYVLDLLGLTDLLGADAQDAATA